MGEEDGGGPGVFNNATVPGVDRGRGVSLPKHRHSAIRWTIDPFTLETQKWNVYQRLEQPFIVEGVKRKAEALLLTSLGSPPSLCDAFVIGFSNPKIQSALLAANNVTWDSVITYGKKEGHLAARCEKESGEQAGGEGKSRSQRHKREDGVAGGSARSPRFIEAELLVNGHRLLTEIDTGVCYSLISEGEWRLLGRLSLKQTRLELVTYTGGPMDVGGEFDALVKWESQKKQLPLLVVAGVGPALVGRNWVRAIRIDCDRILHLPNADAASKMDPFKDVFELGVIKVPLVHLVLKADAVRMLVSPGILYPVVCSGWEAPVVVGPIANGSLRVCSGDKMAVNPALLELEPFSKKRSKINTPFGPHRFSQLLVGFAPAPKKFQRGMDDFFRDLPWVECYPDDILVPGGTEEKQWAPVTEALRRLQAAGVRLSFGRRLVASSELPHLGLILSEDDFWRWDDGAMAMGRWGDGWRFLAKGKRCWRLNNPKICSCCGLVLAW